MKRISKNIIITNPWHSYCCDKVTRKDGSEGDYFYVDHPASIAVIPVFEDGTVIVLRCFRYLVERTMHQVVLGHTSPESNQEDEARRELEEETGYRAEKLVLIGRFTPYSGVSNEIANVFVALGLTAGDVNLEVTEEIEALRMPIDEAKRFLFSGPVTDGQSLAAWTLFEAWSSDREVATDDE